MLHRFRLLPLACVLLFCGGCGIPSFLVTPVQNTNALREETVTDGSGGKILIVEVEGMLLNAKVGGFMQPTENDVSLFVQQLKKAEEDSAVRAVVLRINSPGGTVSASDTMYQNLLKFRQKTKKPVVASAQDLAASGAYFVACGSDKIVVQPTSVVGSIGVIFNTFDLSGTLAKLGARSEAIKSGPLKDMASPFKPLSDPEREVMQGMVNEYYGRFKDVVGSNRHLEGQKLLVVSDGRVFSGQRAVELGLADQSGFLEDAIELAKQLGKSPNAKVVMYKRPYGYSGSIYAQSPAPAPNSTTVNLNLAPSRAFLPTGFYYLWDPG